MATNRAEFFKQQLYQKQNVYLNEKTMEKVLQDMEDFEVFGSKKVPNHSEFMNRLIANYTEEYIASINKLASSIRSELSNDVEMDDRRLEEISTKVAVSVLYSADDLSKRHDKILSFRVRKGLVAHTAESLCLMPIDQDLSYFLRNMILSYLALPSYRRELILYKNEVEKMQNAIDADCVIAYDYRKDDGELNHSIASPYIVDHSDNELRNYCVVQYYTDKYEHPYITSLRISRMSGIVIMHNNRRRFSAKAQECFDAMQRNDIEFGIKEVVIRKVKMDAEALKNYRKKFLERPPMVSYDEKTQIAEFDCSEAQIKYYFSPFGGHAEIID